MAFFCFSKKERVDRFDPFEWPYPPIFHRHQHFNYMPGIYLPALLMHIKNDI